LAVLVVPMQACYVEGHKTANRFAIEITNPKYNLVFVDDNDGNGYSSYDADCHARYVLDMIKEEYRGTL